MWYTECVVDYEVSIHAFRGEGDFGVDALHIGLYGFNPRLPGGRRPANAFPTGGRLRRFNPRLPGGRRRCAAQQRAVPYPFQSTPSGGKATPWRAADGSFMLFQSTPSGGKATRRYGYCVECKGFQSTPSGGKATSRSYAVCNQPAFQSTPSGGKATGARG